MPEEVVTEVVPEVTPPVEPQAPAVEPVQEVKAETPPEPAEEQPRDEKGKFKSPIQERFDTLTRAKHEAEREAAYWRQRANPVQEEAPQAEPTVEQFKDYGDYVKAQTKWEVAQAIKADRAATAQEAVKAAETRVQETKAQTFVERQAAAKTSIADYDAVVGAADVPISRHVEEAILDSDKGPELVYHLAKNPAEAARISALSPLAAARELGRIEATLGQATPAAKPVTKAPAPMKPTAGNGTSPTTDPSKMTHEEYRAYRAKQGARWA